MCKAQKNIHPLIWLSDVHTNYKFTTYLVCYQDLMRQLSVCLTIQQITCLEYCSRIFEMTSLFPDGNSCDLCQNWTDHCQNGISCGHRETVMLSFHHHFQGCDGCQISQRCCGIFPVTRFDCRCMAHGLESFGDHLRDQCG